MFLFVVLFLAPLSALAEPSLSAVPNMAPLNVFCEQQLTEQHPLEREGRAVFLEGLHRVERLQKMTIEACLREPALEAYLIQKVSKSERKKLQFMIQESEMVLLGEGGREILRERLDLQSIWAWNDQRRSLEEKGHLAPDAEIGVFLSSPDAEIRRYLSVRQARGNRLILSLGVDVDPRRTGNYTPPSRPAMARLSIPEGGQMLCRIPVLMINAGAKKR